MLCPTGLRALAGLRRSKGRDRRGVRPLTTPGDVFRRSFLRLGPEGVVRPAHTPERADRAAPPPTRPLRCRLLVLGRPARSGRAVTSGQGAGCRKEVGGADSGQDVATSGGRCGRALSIPLLCGPGSGPVVHLGDHGRSGVDRFCPAHLGPDRPRCGVYQVGGGLTRRTQLDKRPGTHARSQPIDRPEVRGG